MGEHELPGIIPLTILRFAQREGHDVDRVFAHFPVPPRDLHRRSRSARWADVVRLFERLEMEDPAALSRMADHYVTSFPAVSAVAAYVVSVDALYRAFVFAIGRVWKDLLVEAKSAPRLWHVTARVAPCHPPSPALLRMFGEILMKLPKSLGLASATVVSEIDGRVGTYRALLPQDRGTRSDPEDEPDVIVRRALRGAFFAIPEQLYLPGEWGLTPAEKRVVTAVVAGKSPRAIAAELEIGIETVRTHLKHAMAKAGATRQAELVARVLDRSG